MEEAGVITVNRVVREGFSERVTFELLAFPGNLSNPETELLHCWQIPYRLSHQRSPSVTREGSKPKSEGRGLQPEGPAEPPGGKGLGCVSPRKVSVGNEQGGSILNQAVRGLGTQALQTLSYSTSGCF